ncbi:hypothetical protein VKT23_008080 [Stygiomarasmius scandens]|uniref:Pheromone receptor n=1 Tax=Marasmiellus scandens TaxID=2682957 RepID=A0ABR1JJ83_9AGAR
MISATTWRIVTTVLAGTAQLITVFRIIYRYRKACCWFDDIAGALATGCSLVGLVSFWFYSNGVERITHLKVDLATAYWAFTMASIIVIWLSRIGLSLTLIRISPLDLRQIPYAILALCSLMGIALLAERGVLCSRDSTWKSLADPQCNNTTILATTIALEFFSSLIMLFGIARTYAFCDNVRTARHGMFIALFITSCFLFAASIGHAVFLVRGQHHPEDLTERFTFTIQAAISLALTNLPTTVVACYLSVDETLDDPEADHNASSVRKSHNSILSRNIGLPRAASMFSDRESFFPSEKTASLDPGFLIPPLNSRKSGSRFSGMSKSSGSASSYSADSAYQGRIMTSDLPSGSTIDLSRFDRASRDSISANPLLNPPKPTASIPRPRQSSRQSAPRSSRSVRSSPSRTEAKMVRFLSRLISDERSARFSTSDGSEAFSTSMYSSYFMDNHPSLYLQSARSSEVLDYDPPRSTPSTPASQLLQPGRF